MATEGFSQHSSRTASPLSSRTPCRVFHCFSWFVWNPSHFNSWGPGYISMSARGSLSQTSVSQSWHLITLVNFPDVLCFSYLSVQSRVGDQRGSWAKQPQEGNGVIWETQPASGSSSKRAEVFLGDSASSRVFLKFMTSSQMFFLVNCLV